MLAKICWETQGKDEILSTVRDCGLVPIMVRVSCDELLERGIVMDFDLDMYSKTAKADTCVSFHGRLTDGQCSGGFIASHDSMNQHELRKGLPFCARKCSITEKGLST